MQRQRHVTADLDPVDVVPVENARRPATEERSEGQARDPATLHRSGSDEVEASLERGLRRDAKREAAEVGVGIAVGDEGESRGFPVHLERGLEAAAVSDQHAGHGQRERPVRRPPPVRSSEPVDATDDLGGKAHRRREAEAAPVDASDGDPANTVVCERLGDLHRCGLGSEGKTERPREYARSAAGDEADRNPAPHPVQHLVEAAVAAEDDDRVGVGRTRELGSVPGPLRLDRVSSHDRRDSGGALGGDSACVRIDDQKRLGHGGATMPRIDHVAVETDDPDSVAAFYERILGARVVKTEGHPVMAYVGNTGFAFHELGGPGEHTAVRMSPDEQEKLKRRLDAAGIPWEERDHEIAVGVFFQDPDGRQLEAIVYAGVE